MKKYGCVNCDNFAKFCAEENDFDNSILYTVTRNAAKPPGFSRGKCQAIIKEDMEP